jgi:hypothetical protein
MSHLDFVWISHQLPFRTVVITIAMEPFFNLALFGMALLFLFGIIRLMKLGGSKKKQRERKRKQET